MYRSGFGDATVPTCPAGYGVPTFQDGLSTAMKGLPVSLLSGPMYLVTSFGGGSNPGNVLVPGAAATQTETVCYQAQRETLAHRLGMAAPGLTVIGIAAWWLFGSRRAH